MRRAFALAIAVVCASGHALEDSESYELTTTKARTLLSFPGTTLGPLIEDTPETVFHWSASNWNMIRFSEGFDNAAWSKLNGGTVTVPVVTADQVANPIDGSMTADRVDFPAVPAGAHNAAMVRSSVTLPSGTYTFSFYIRGVSGPGTLYLYLYSPFTTATCNYTAATWTRCSVTGTGASFVLADIGVNLDDAAESPQVSPQSVYLWGAQLVRGTVPLPYGVARVANVANCPSKFDTTPSTGCWISNTNNATVTATLDAAYAPDGSKTADQLAFSAVSGGSDYAYLGQSQAFGAATFTFGAWLRGDTAGTVTLTARVLTSPGPVTTALSVPCSYTTAWSWCGGSITPPKSGTGYLSIGTNRPLWGDPARPAQTVYVWNYSLVRSDLQGDGIVMSGTAPLVTTSTLFPTGSGAGRRFVGPFTAANYLRWQTATPVQFTGDHTICVAYVRNVGSTSTNFLHTLDGGATTGWYFQDGVGTVSYHEISNSVDKSAAVTATTTPGALNVLCGGRSGTTIYAKLNAGVTATATNAAVPVSYPTDMYIGQWSGTASLLGYVYEVWATTTAWSEGNVANIEAAALANGGKGTIFPDDAGTVLHLVGNAYNGSTWKAPQATLTTTGAVPYSDVWVPASADQLQRQAYGPFTDANYFALGSGLDVLDFAGDFTMCATFGAPGALGASGTGIASDGVYQSAGWEFGLTAAGAGAVVLNTSGAATTATTTNAATTGPNVACWGRSGRSALVKLNLGTTVTQAGSNIAAATTTTAKIGRYSAAGQPFQGPIYEVWASTETPTDALFTKIQRRVFQHFLAQGQPLGVTRSSGATFELPSGAVSTPTVLAVPAATAVTPPDGVEVWRGSTNLVLNSSAFDQASWTKTGTAGQEAQVTATDSAIAPDGTQTADTLYLSTVTTAQRSQIYAGVNGYAALPIIPHTTTVWVKGVSDTATIYIRPWIAALGRTIVSGPCTYNPTTWTRCSLTWTPDAGNSGTVVEIGQVFALHGAQNEKKFYAWGFQTEATPYATPYIPTGGTTAARGTSNITIASSGSIPNPIPANGANWCLRFTARPGASHSWLSGETYTFIASGAPGSANSFSLVQGSAGSLVFTVYDAAAAAKWTSVPGLADSSAHDVAMCLWQATPYIYIDGYRATGVSDGLGTGIIAAPQSSMYLGCLAGSYCMDGVVSDVQVCDRPTGACMPNTSPTAANATAYYPWSQSGSFVTDANTIANVTFSGSAIVDPYNVTTPWTMVGSVGQNLSSPFYRTGFSGAQVKGAGPFDAAVYYKLVGGGALGFPGGVGSMCWAYNKYTGYGAAAAVALGAFGVYNTSGWMLTDDGTFFINGAGVNRSITSDTPTLFGLNIVCAGLNNDVASIKVNGGAFASQIALASPYVPPTGDATLGWYAANKFLNGSLLAFWASTTPPSDALFKKQIQSFLGSIGATNSELLTTTRTTAAYGLGPDGGLYAWPPGVPRVACDGSSSKCGLQVEPARTNVLTYSQTFDPVAWTPLNMTTTAVAGGGPGGVDAERVTVTSGVAASSLSQAYATSGAQTFTFSVWLKAGTQGLYASIQILKDASGGTCVIVPLTSTWTRYVVTDTQTYTASATAEVFANSTCGGSAGVVGDNFYLAAPQLELGAYPTSYIPTTTTAATRNADAITTPNYISFISSFCVDGVWTPEGLHPWVAPSGSAYLWVTGSGVGANTYKIYGDSTAFHGEMRDVDNLYRQLDVTLPSTFTAGSSHRVSFDYIYTGLSPSTLKLDNGYNYGTLSGPGTGVINYQQITTTLGANSAAGSEWGGFIRHFRFCNSGCQSCR